MPISIHEYLSQNHIDLRATIYKEEEKGILQYPMILGDFLTFEDRGSKQEWFSEEIIWYKKTVWLTTLEVLAQSIRTLQGIEAKELHHNPLFVSNIEYLNGAIKDNRPIGIEGGPCLLGYDEMKITVVHKDGKCFYFDFAGKRSYEKHSQEKERCMEETLDFHVQTYKSEIVDISFHNKKATLTRGDFLSILFVFEFAKALGAKAIIPIVDLSYRKYIANVCMGLDEILKNKTIKAFQESIYKVSDVYLRWIEKVRESYPQVEAFIFHERNRELCDVFYQGRKPYLSSYKKVNRFTTDELRRESILDYVTMPALPFYRWGIRDIVQVDCIAEVDAYRNCRKLHGKDIRLCGVFYPEPAGLDGKHSDYSSKFTDKKYIQMESWELERHG